MLPNRTFGVELEMIGLGIADVNALFRKNKIKCSIEYGGYGNDDFFTKWAIKTDSSIKHQGKSCEVSSPILKGAKGLRTLAKVCQLLVDNGARVNKSCGLHVHVGGRGLSNKAIRTIVSRYSDWEDEIDSVMPMARRGNKNTYAKSMKQYDEEKYSRYYKINLLALEDYGTLEFRHHHGSVDPASVVNWVKFVLNFVENSKLVSQDRMKDVSPFATTQIPRSVRTFYKAKMNERT